LGLSKHGKQTKLEILFSGVEGQTYFKIKLLNKYLVRYMWSLIKLPFGPNVRTYFICYRYHSVNVISWSLTLCPRVITLKSFYTMRFSRLLFSFSFSRICTKVIALRGFQNTL
jgi:hypothetical protein